MNLLHPKAESVAREYIGTTDPLEELGYGVEGVVYSSLAATTAIKVHTQEEALERELAVYKRLRRHRITRLQGFNIPKLVNFDTRLFVIEMSIVKPPFLLDFAQSTLDYAPEFPEGLNEWWDRIRERFDDRFPIVQSVFWELQNTHGIYYWDLKPGNIEFGRTSS